MQASRTESFSLAGAAVAGTLTGVAILSPALWSVGLAAAASGFWMASAINHARGKRALAIQQGAHARPEAPSRLVSQAAWDEWRIHDIEDNEAAREAVNLYGRVQAPVETSIAELAGQFMRVLLRDRGFIDILTKREDEHAVDVSCVGHLTSRASGQLMNVAKSRGLSDAEHDAPVAARGVLAPKLGLMRSELISFAAASDRNISLATLHGFLLAIENARGVVAELSWSVNRAHSQFVSDGHITFGFRSAEHADTFSPRMLEWRREFSRHNWEMWIKT